MVEKRTYHRSRLFYILSGIVGLILIGGLFYWHHYKYKLVNKTLDKLVTGKSRGLYSISYHNLVIDEALGNVSVEDVELLPDSAIYQSLEDNHQSPDNLFYIRIPSLHLTGVKTPKALLNREISAHILRIENANIELRLGHSKKKQNTDVTQFLNGSAYRQLLGNLKSIEADSIVLENAMISLTDRQSGRVLTRLTGMSIRFAGTSVDSSAGNDSTRILFSRELTLHCDKIELPSRDRIYTFQINGLDFNSADRVLQTGPIRLIPSLSETAFARSNHFAKDRFNISVEKLSFRNLNRQFMLNGGLVADTLQLTGASVHVFRDKSYPHDSVDRTKSYPQQALMTLPFDISIRKLIVRDSYIEYKEKNDKSDSSGKVSFYKVQAVIENITNMQSIIKKRADMVLHFDASFLDQTSFHTTITMPLNDKLGRFKLDAQLGSLDAAALNPLLRPMALAELDKGRITGLTYHLDATDTKASGTVRFLYEDLSVKLLKKDDDQNKYKSKFLPTLAAGVLLKRSNPQNNKTRIGQVDYMRDIHRSIFNLMWKSLFSGIKQVAL
jgi:hypothetical protein